MAEDIVDGGERSVGPPLEKPGRSKNNPGAPVPNQQNILEAIRELARTHPTPAALLLAAFVLVLVIGLTVSLGQNLQNVVPSVVYVIGGGLAVLIVGRWLDDGLMSKALTGFLFVLFAAWIVSFVVLRPVFPAHVQVNCFAEFWRNPREIADDIARWLTEQNASATNIEVPPEGVEGPQIPPPPEADIDPARYRVFVQFGGDIRRGDIRALMEQLEDAEWDVQDADGGGERLARAVGLAEIRYGTDDDKAAAEALADALLASGRVYQRYKTVKTNGVLPNNLEIWIGNYFGVSTGRQIEAALRLLGIPLPENPTTSQLSDAVRQFQSEHDLAADGIVGPKTLLYLKEAAPTAFVGS
jgi:hypothetical protein